MRIFSKYCESDNITQRLVDDLLELQDDPMEYRSHMQQIGGRLGQSILPALSKSPDNADICVICTVEDADFLARGLVEALEEQGMGNRIHFICMWNDKIRESGVSVSPVIREYKEDFNTNNAIFVVIKSIISGACVVKTNLTRAISHANPQKIFVAAPVLLKGAEERLQREFPLDITGKFEFVHFATDDEKDGEEVIPGIGGSLYELLGLGNSKEKNHYVPAIVKERRKKFFGPKIAIPA
ncbi:hypothetical protein [Herbaspirillum rubrisubalbicans]|uniref:Uncharacterized protein n=1 Tax=Herbaspirillum rubrisubalbicans TaxID=80842 RepID=A0ABX9BU82_9BURK|nr:hypothetical protein [Herbaspirillum rubrisubalbicans]RAM61228.1 hypothetical protein RB24_26230 [Herbaspirillum rubrisubalbicans]